MGWRRFCCCCIGPSNGDIGGSAAAEGQAPLIGPPRGCRVPPRAWLAGETGDAAAGAAREPRTVLLPCQLHELLLRLPAHLQQRRLRLAYGTAAHGYSHHALRRRVEQLPARGSTAALLVVHAGGAVFGAFLSCLPQWHTAGRRYHGTQATFVFRLADATRADVRVFAAAEALAAAGADGDDGTSVNAEARGNTNYIRAEEAALSIGGGGDGPAIRLSDNMTRVCSAACPTFASPALLAGAATLPDDATTAKVSAVELWVLTEEFAAAVPSGDICCTHDGPCSHECQ
jgi:hypothetical protein